MEGNTAWFVSSEYNILFQLDLNTGQYDFLAELPNNSQSKFRSNQNCIKCGDSIFCLPDNGSHILVYNLHSQNFEHINIVNPDKKRIAIIAFVEYESSLYAVSRGLNAIIEINIQKKRINHYYQLPELVSDSLRCGVKVNDSLYLVSIKTNHVCQFDFVTKKITMNELPNISGGLYTICYDGSKFWLTSLRKEVYTWNEENNDVKILKGFPEDFGIYRFGKTKGPLLDCVAEEYDQKVFIKSVFVKGEVWFIPQFANKIIYVDKETFQMKVFEIEGEEETEISLKQRKFYAKYFLMCVIEERYIILYSIKRGIYIRIDTVNKTVTEEGMHPSRSCLHELMQMQSEDILYEQRFLDSYLYKQLLLDSYVAKETASNVGAMIYNVLCNND